MYLWTALASLCVQYPALFGHFPPDIFVLCKSLVLIIMLTGSGSVLMAGLCITLGSTRGLWLVTPAPAWPLIGWWGCSDGAIFRGLINVWSRLHTDYSTRQEIISQVLIIMNEPHQSLSKYAKQERYYLYCSAIRSINGWVTGCWIESRCSLPL